MTDRPANPDNDVAKWMISRGYATGHGDTTEDMLAELEAQAIERGKQINRESAS